jgi:hypothetical protein
MSTLGRAAGALLILLAIYVILSTTIQVFGDIGAGAPILAFLFAWLLLLLVSSSTINLGKNWVQQKKETPVRLAYAILIMIPGVIVILYFTAGLFVYASQLSFTLEYLATVYLPRLAVGIFSLVYGVVLARAKF